MKLLTQFSDINEANEVSQHLINSGVVVKLMNVPSHMLSATSTGALRIGLWVVFDVQHEDAIKLLNDPNHQPKTALTIEEINEIESNSIEHQQKITVAILKKSIIWLVVLILILVAIFGF